MTRIVVPIDGSKSDDPPSPLPVAPRLRLLLAVHLVVGTAPSAMFLAPADIRALPLIWTLASVSLAQVMLLSFWAGMGTSKGPLRWLGTLLGSAYVAIWPMLALVLSPHAERKSASVWIGEYIVGFSLICLIVALLAGVFLLCRRWMTALRLVPDPSEFFPPTRFQYSILQVLVVTSVVAVVLGLMRSARTANAGASAEWQFVASQALMIVVLLINSVCAAWATLSGGPIRVRVCLVFVVASLLGVALALGGFHDSLAWWIFPCFVLPFIIPTAIVVLSLLVVRSCGYRLVPKAMALS